MNNFDALLLADAAAFTDDDEFGETVIYRNAAGEREIKAVIERSPPMPVNEAQGSVAPYMRASVANHCTLGITPAELDLGADRIDVKKNVRDESYTTYSIKLIEKQDAGMLLLQVR